MQSMAQAYDHLLKLLLIGDAGVGKSSLLLRFCDDTFDDHIQSTIGVDFKVKHATIDDKKVKLTVWDTAGQERFRTLTSSYYRGAHAVLLVYDVTRRDTFDNLTEWLSEVSSYSPNKGTGVVKLLVGNKLDLLEDSTAAQAVSTEEANAWAQSNGMLFLQASAKNKTGVAQCFNEVVRRILENPELLQNTAPGKPRITLQPEPQAAQGGCC
jgi:Ras-related protein Rab-18